MSRELRKPQTESVKKNVVIESYESIRESFPSGAAILLRNTPASVHGDGEMTDKLLTRIVHFGERHERPIVILGWVWLGISTLAWMPWAPIPEIPYVTDRHSWVLSGAYNMLWWGFAHPALEQKREEMRAARQQSDDPQISKD